MVLATVKGVHDVEDRAKGLFLVVRADVDVIARDPVVRRDQGDGLEGDRSVLARASTDHAKQVWPPWELAVPPVGAVMEDDDELLPGEQLLEREILGQAEIMVGLIGVDIDVLILETIEDMIDEGLDLFVGAELSGLNEVNKVLNMRA